MYREPDHQGLFGTASTQLGHFTAHQAAEHGFGTDDVSYHTKTGRFIRVLPRVYRLRDYPFEMNEEVAAAWLAVGREHSVVSHESALDLLDLSDVIPNAIHITVPRTRRNLPKLPGVRIHTTTRSPMERRETVWRGAILVTSPVRAILDAAEVGVGPEQIEMAVWQSLRRGLALPDEFMAGVSEYTRRVKPLVTRAVAYWEEHGSPWS